MIWSVPRPVHRVPTMDERAATTAPVPAYGSGRRCAACGRLGNPPGAEVILPDAPALHMWADMLLCKNPTACREHCVKIGTWKS
jgi:hypothetical protein